VDARIKSGHDDFLDVMAALVAAIHESALHPYSRHGSATARIVADSGLR
jgi:hypothetical protein